MKYPDKDFTVLGGYKLSQSLHNQGFTTKFFLAPYRWLMVNEKQWMFVDFVEGEINTYQYYSQEEYTSDLKEMSEWWEKYLKQNIGGRAFD